MHSSMGVGAKVWSNERSLWKAVYMSAARNLDKFDLQTTHMQTLWGNPQRESWVFRLVQWTNVIKPKGSIFQTDYRSFFFKVWWNGSHCSPWAITISDVTSNWNLQRLFSMRRSMLIFFIHNCGRRSHNLRWYHEHERRLPLLFVVCSGDLDRISTQ